jgi:DNA-binding IclR family transcriptional regulator
MKDLRERVVRQDHAELVADQDVVMAKQEEEEGEVPVEAPVAVAPRLVAVVLGLLVPVLATRISVETVPVVGLLVPDLATRISVEKGVLGPDLVLVVAVCR